MYQVRGCTEYDMRICLDIYFPEQVLTVNNAESEQALMKIMII